MLRLLLSGAVNPCVAALIMHVVFNLPLFEVDERYLQFLLYDKKGETAAKCPFKVLKTGTEVVRVCKVGIVAANVYGLKSALPPQAVYTVHTSDSVSVVSATFAAIKSPSVFFMPPE